MSAVAGKSRMPRKKNMPKNEEIGRLGLMKNLENLILDKL
jgi:hypothetical protein